LVKKAQRSHEVAIIRLAKNSNPAHLSPSQAMNIHIYAENRRTKKRSRKRQKSSSPIIVRAVKRTVRWARNFVLILVGLSLLITLSLRWINPPYTSFMIVQRVSTNFIPYKINWVPVKEISPHLLIAAVAAEDQKFPDHYGFDLKAIQSALEQNKNQKSLRGASTITQQVAKNVFLWPKKSFFRKGLEAYFALLIETLWPKWRILEVYLNVAQHEASLLAAVLPNPHKLHASQPSNYVRERAEHISSQARSLGGAGYLKSIWE